MRIMALCAVFFLGCSSGANESGSNAKADGGDVPFDLGLGEVRSASCGESTFVVHRAAPFPDGEDVGKAKIASATVDVSTSPAKLTADLEGGGVLSLHWKGDATKAAVPAWGSVTWPNGDTWCVDGADEHTTIRLAGEKKIVFERFYVAERADVSVTDDHTRCHAPPKDGVPAPLPGVTDYDACASLP
jgi:hypothetical protein